MTEYELSAEFFTEADRGDLIGFSCGESVAGKACTEWIQGSDVVDSMKRGTVVWIYRNEADEVVGFGSLGPARWRWPPPNGNFTNLAIIPMLGIDERFQGQPADKQWRYSHQIMNHLIYEAHELSVHAKKPLEWLLLLVLPGNERAIKLYEQFDFELIPNVTRGQAGSRVMKHRLAN